MILNGSRREWKIPGSPRKEDWPVEQLRRELKWAKEKLRRKDRIVWFMWHARLAIIYRILDNERQAYNSAKVAVMFVNKGKPDDQKKPMPEPSDTLTAMHAIFREYVTMFEKRMGYSAAHHSGDWGYVPKASLAHYASLDEVGATEVSKIVWLRQEPDQLVQQLRRAEQKWQERETNRFVNSSPDDIVVHTFPNGFQWVLLNRPSCSEEGEAMGHCGNAGAKAGDRILSLRRIEKKGKSKGLRPHLTFVLHKNGALS